MSGTNGKANGTSAGSKEPAWSQTNGNGNGNHPELLLPDDELEATGDLLRKLLKVPKGEIAK